MDFCFLSLSLFLALSPLPPFPAPPPLAPRLPCNAVDRPRSEAKRTYIRGHPAHRPVLADAPLQLLLPLLRALLPPPVSVDPIGTAAVCPVIRARGAALLMEVEPNGEPSHCRAVHRIMIMLMPRFNHPWLQ